MVVGAGLVGASVAYLDLRTSVRGRRLLDYLAVLPLGLPGTVMAVGILLAFLRSPIPIYGTIWILLVAYVARFVPLATRSANATFRQVDASLEEDLVFAGLIGMIDPPRDEAKEAVRRARGAGVRPIMITGDHPRTASVIASDGRYSDAELRAFATALSPWFDSLRRATPQQLRGGDAIRQYRAWPITPSPLFETVVSADGRNGTSNGWRYYQAALRVAHAGAQPEHVEPTRRLLGG